MSQQRLYMSYLVRLWQAHTEGEPTWRAWVENASTGERQGFATLDELFDYLKAKVSFLECVSQSSDDDPTSAGVSEEAKATDQAPLVESRVADAAPIRDGAGM